MRRWIFVIINQELFDIEDQCEAVLEKIRTSNLQISLQKAKQKLAESLPAQRKITMFNEAKVAFEQVADYGTYAPDYQQLRKKLFETKRHMDLDKDIYGYRLAERDFQVQLDLIANRIATAVSENIIVTAGDAFSLSATGLPEACEIHLEKRKEIEF